MSVRNVFPNKFLGYTIKTRQYQRRTALKLILKWYLNIRIHSSRSVFMISRFSYGLARNTWNTGGPAWRPAPNAQVIFPSLIGRLGERPRSDGRRIRYPGVPVALDRYRSGTARTVARVIFWHGRWKKKIKNIPFSIPVFMAREGKVGERHTGTCRTQNGSLWRCEIRPYSPHVPTTAPSPAPRKRTDIQPSVSAPKVRLYTYVVNEFCECRINFVRV